MIKINDVEISFSNMGLFMTHDPWLHPTRIINSHEIICVLDGEFDLKEDEKTYRLKPNSIFFLEPNLKHGGVKKTTGLVRFFWLHFYCDTLIDFNLNKLYTEEQLEKELYLFQEIMTYQQTKNTALCEIKLAELLLKLSGINHINHPKIVSEILEYIRINADKNLTVNKICSNFGYSPDHCSRIIKKYTGVSLHSLINKTRIKHIKTSLLNTNFTIKRLSELCGFEDENTFVKFFKYHTKVSPSQYRNGHNGIKVNNH